MLEEDEASERPPVADSRAAPILRVVVSPPPDRLRVSLFGELDDATAPMLRDRLAEVTVNIDGDLVLDLDGLTFLDSSGLTLFVLLHKELEDKGQRLVLLNPTPMARRVLKLMGLDSLLQIEPTVP